MNNLRFLLIGKMEGCAQDSGRFYIALAEWSGALKRGFLRFKSAPVFYAVCAMRPERFLEMKFL